jgi:hypothetical protein
MIRYVKIRPRGVWRPLGLGCQISKSEYFFWFQDIKIITKNAVRFVLRGNLLNKTQGFHFLRWNLYGRYPQDVQFQNSE